jgi:hypothetical protein
MRRTIILTTALALLTASAPAFAAGSGKTTKHSKAFGRGRPAQCSGCSIPTPADLAAAGKVQAAVPATDYVKGTSAFFKAAAAAKSTAK